MFGILKKMDNANFLSHANNVEKTQINYRHGGITFSKVLKMDFIFQNKFRRRALILVW